MRIFALGMTLAGSVLLTACGGSEDNQTQTHVPLQPVKLPDNFSYVKEPLKAVMAEPLYNFSYWVEENPIQIYNYSLFTQMTNGKFQSTYYSVSNTYSNTWRLDPRTRLVFNIAQNRWVESDGATTMTEGVVGSEGIKTIHVVSDTGVKYYTLTEKDLSGLTIDKGVNVGFGEGRALPTAISSKTFSQGAKAYAWVQDITQPVYAIDRTHIVFTSRNDTHPIHSCSSISSYCSSTISTLENAINTQSWYQNGGENASVRLGSNGQATLTVYDKTTKKDLTYPLTYTLKNASQGQPKHIVFDTNNQAAKKLLQEKFSIGDSQLAWYEYNGKVVNGTYSMPVMGLQSTQYSYNKTAINDILTKWSPSKNAVLN